MAFAHVRTRTLALLVAATGWVAATAAQHPAPAPAASPPAAPDFARDVLPVFETHCLRCHSAAAQKGGLILDAHEDLLAGGRKGSAIVPGDGHASRLVGMMEGRVEPRMPPKGELRPDEILVVRKWIDAGAKDSPAASMTLDARIPRIRPAADRLPAVNSLAFSPDGRELIVPGYQEVRRVPLSGAAPSGTARSSTPASSRTGPMRLARTLDDPKLDALRTLGGAVDLVRSVAFSRDGWWIAGAGGIPGALGEVLIWDAETGEPAQALKGHRDYVYDAAFNHRNTRLATCSYDRSIRIWDLDTGRAMRVLREHTEAVYAVAFSPDDKWVASGAGDRSVKVWDVRSGRRLYTLTDPIDAVMTVDFDPAGGRLTAAGADKTIRTWTVTAQGGTQVVSVIAHGAPILRIAYSPDGRQLASTASDGAVKIWDTRTWREARILERQPDWAQALAWSADGRRLAIGRYDGTVSVYDPRSGRRVQDVIGAPRKAPSATAGRASAGREQSAER